MKPAVRQEPLDRRLPALTREVVGCKEHGLGIEPFERALLSGAREFLARPSKAFRARMVEACFVVAGGPQDRVPAACIEAIELLHSGSLIVDDIQDDAETRRGASALHRQVGMPQALNTGNWLYFVALSRLDELELEPTLQNQLTRAAHLCLMRCHEGQALDLSMRIGEAKRCDVSALALTTSTLKTGALMGFAARLGASVAGAEKHQVDALCQFGEQVGIALQMLDDLGSFTASDRHHKALEDLTQQRVSWVWAWASEVLDEVRFKQLARQVARKEDLELARARLAEAVSTLGRRRVHHALESTLDDLRARVADSPALRAFSAELTRLENSYG